MGSPIRVEKNSAAPSGFSEVAAWREFGEGWRPLFGSFRGLGYSIEWHDFTARYDFDWSRTFHPGSVEICLNLAGTGQVEGAKQTLSFTPFTAGFYAPNGTQLVARRQGGERHQFVTIELSFPFLECHIPAEEQKLHPRLSGLFANRDGGVGTVSEAMRLTNEQQQIIMNLRHPPVVAAAQRLWYQAKVMEAAATMLYQPLPGGELFCQRQQRLNQDRVEKVMAILRESFVEPPSLQEIGRRVGCSHFHLSRIVTQETGKTISAHVRDLRLERAAGLLREGRLNVTEVALEVGYSSPSHFSTAFREVFGCCPGLYPIAPNHGKLAGAIETPLPATRPEFAKRR